MSRQDHARRDAAGARGLAGRGMLAAALLSGVLLGASCSQAPEPPAKDFTTGEYYTVEEMSRLSASERERYCESLQATLGELKAEASMLRARYDSLDAASTALREESVDLSGQTRALTNQLRELRLKEKALTSYVVRPGDTLQSIAARVYGDQGRWRRIYEANKGKLGAENTELRPGTRLDVPRDDR